MGDALGLCGSLAAGSMQFLVDGAWNKPFHTGYAAMNGLVAACMAREGFRGAREAIEGRAGFLHAYAPNANPALADADLGKRWETLRIAIKPYPSCRYSHAPMDALIALRDEHDIDWHDVTSVEVGLSRTGWDIIGDPEEEKQRPTSYVDGQFSMPFCAAVALRDGTLTWDSYRTHVGNPDTLNLCRRVHTVVDDRAEADFPDQMSGLAKVTTARGTYESYVRIPKGEPENFLTRAELKAKFDGLAAPYMGANRRDALAQALLAIDEADDVAEILRMTRPVETDTVASGAAGDD
jgi:2-methylcitrate dehydratase PrpD